MNKFLNRKEVPKKYQWDLTDFYKTNDDWYNDFKKISESLNQVENYKNKLNDAYLLEEYLKLDIDLSHTMLDLYIYADLSHDVELEDNTYIEMVNKALSLFNEYDMLNAFAVPEILKISEEDFHKLFISNPNLNDYKRYLEDIYSMKKHTLDEEQEKIITALTETYSSYSNISSTMLNSEHDYGKIKLDDNNVVTIASNNIRHLKMNKDEKVRKQVSKKFGDVLARYKTTESTLLNNYVKNNINLAKIRNYESPWHKKMEQTHMESVVFEKLQQVARKNNKINQKYYKLMKDVLKLSVLHSYDVALNWSNSNTEYTIEEAQETTKNALKVLGNDYLEKLNKVYENHYIDYCQYKGKTSGGYSCSTYRKNSRILLSYNGSMSDIFTIIHEVGHNIHHQYINDNNLEWYRSVPSIVAEVASLTNEILLSDYLYKNGKSKEEKLIGLEKFIKTFQNNFFGAIMEGELELKMYDHVSNGNSITAKYLNDETNNLLKYYRGNTVKNDKYTNLMWVTRSHYYMNFYLFSYAICMSVACVVANKILSNDNNILNQYKEFLSCGSNLHPMEIFEKLDIDLKNEKMYEQAVKYFDSKLELYNELNKEGE